MAGGMRTALIVEDDTALLSLLEDALTAEGFATTCLLSMSAALWAIEEQRFDVIVTDINLPDSNGLKLCDVAREQYGDRPIILVTVGADNQRHTATALHLGADAVVDKPFDLNELIPRIERIQQRILAA